MTAKPAAKWSDMDKYLKPEHLNGKTFTLTIKSVMMIEMHPHAGLVEVKPVCFFTETSKGLILTATNQDALREAFGDDVAACFGQRVTLHAVTLTVAARQVETIRLAPATAPSQQVTPPTTPTPPFPNLHEMTSQADADKYGEEVKAYEAVFGKGAMSRGGNKYPRQDEPENGKAERDPDAF